jgi:hypothetical protein
LRLEDYDRRVPGLLELRKQAQTSQNARDILRNLIYDDDGAIRMLAAEALSKTRAYPEDSVPVLKTVLDVTFENNLFEKARDWLFIALGALGNYGEYAVEAEESAWPYLYAQEDLQIKLRTMNFLSKVAPFSAASRSILKLLRSHVNKEIRKYAEQIELL